MINDNNRIFIVRQNAIFLSECDSADISQNDNFYFRYKIKARIDKCAKLCMMMTSSMIENDIKVKNIEQSLSLITVSQLGCVESLARYDEQLHALPEKRFASLRDYVQSLHNIPNAVAAKEFGIHGMTSHYVGGGDTAILAMWQATQNLLEGLATSVIVCSFDTPYSEYTVHRTIKCSDTVSGILLKSRRNEGKYCGIEVLGFGFSIGGSIDDAVEKAVTQALVRSGMNFTSVEYIIPHAWNEREFYEGDGKIIGRIFGKIPKLLFLKPKYGECFSVYPLLTLAKIESIIMKDIGNIPDADVVILLYACGEYENCSAVCLRYIKKGEKDDQE